MASETEQVQNIMTFIGLMAERALELPPDQRTAFIDGEILRLRDAFTGDADEHGKKKADEFADKLRGWVLEMLQMIEGSDGGTGSA
jgi:hypothetical protein